MVPADVGLREVAVPVNCCGLFEGGRGRGVVLNLIPALTAADESVGIVRIQLYALVEPLNALSGNLLVSLQALFAPVPMHAADAQSRLEIPALSSERLLQCVQFGVGVGLGPPA